MTKRLWGAALLVAATTGGALPANASPAEDRGLEVTPSTPLRAQRFVDKPFALQGILGFGSDVGLVGMKGQYTVLDALALGGGVGINASGHPQLAAFANFRPITWSNKKSVNALSLMGGYSTGKYEAYDISDFSFMSSMSHSSEPEPRYVVDRAHWLQVDVGFERQFARGFSFRSAIGAAYLLNQGSAYCRNSRSPHETLPCAGETRGTPPDKLLFTMTLALGYAF
jgi:hypothetical protein